MDWDKHGVPALIVVFALGVVVYNVHYFYAGEVPAPLPTAGAGGPAPPPFAAGAPKGGLAPSPAAAGQREQETEPVQGQFDVPSLFVLESEHRSGRTWKADRQMLEKTDSIAGKLVLNGILFSKRDPFAIVNGECRRQGDTFVLDGAKVLVMEIAPRRALFQIEGRSVERVLTDFFRSDEGGRSQQHSAAAPGGTGTIAPPPGRGAGPPPSGPATAGAPAPAGPPAVAPGSTPPTASGGAAPVAGPPR